MPQAMMVRSSELIVHARLQNASVEHTWALPPNTFGGAYARFMGDRNFQADDR